MVEEIHSEQAWASRSNCNNSPPRRVSPVALCVSRGLGVIAHCSFFINSYDDIV